MCKYKAARNNNIDEKLIQDTGRVEPRYPAHVAGLVAGEGIRPRKDSPVVPRMGFSFFLFLSRCLHVEPRLLTLLHDELFVLGAELRTMNVHQRWLTNRTAPTTPTTQEQEEDEVAGVVPCSRQPE